MKRLLARRLRDLRRETAEKRRDKGMLIFKHVYEIVLESCIHTRRAREDIEKFNLL